MSKWILDFPPNVSGNYLIKTIVTLSGRDLDPTYTRLDFNSNTGKWYVSGYPVPGPSIGLNFRGYWWDEYGITETKKVIKIKF